MRTEEEILNKLRYMEYYSNIIIKHLNWYEEKIVFLRKKFPTKKILKKFNKYKIKIEAIRYFLYSVKNSKAELIWCICGLSEKK